MRTLVRFLSTVLCVEELTFRFEDEEGAVILDGWAHRPGCPRLPAPLPARAQRVPTGGVVLSERCPYELSRAARISSRRFVVVCVIHTLVAGGRHRGDSCWSWVCLLSA
ncbi:MAG: hypothetical protein ACLP0J_25655, partial [Solirubrobacteraceae bacterium]